jgi:hypothetical protein
MTAATKTVQPELFQSPKCGRISACVTAGNIEHSGNPKTLNSNEIELIQFKNH